MPSQKIPILRVHCKHDQGFSCIGWQEGTLAAKYAYICNNSGCGYFLNFDPDRFPHGTAILDKPKAGLKVQAKLKTSKF